MENLLLQHLYARILYQLFQIAKGAGRKGGFV